LNEPPRDQLTSAHFQRRLRCFCNNLSASAKAALDMPSSALHRCDAPSKGGENVRSLKARLVEGRTG
jgi:hypothetical protein